MTTTVLHSLADLVADHPPLLWWRRRRFNKRFESGEYSGWCRGIYPNYSAAAAAAPTTLPTGYDNEGAASLYRERLERIYPSDYPMLFWLRHCITGGARRIFDLGGNVGIAYYAYQTYLPYPLGLTWCVHDVPKVMKAGKALAQTRDQRQQLNFAERFDEAEQADVLFTSGCLQYLEQTFAEKLSALQNPPQWLLINLLPLHDRYDYWTVQCIGKAFCPYHIQYSETFFQQLSTLGYNVVDRWQNIEKRCRIAFNPSLSLDHYFGAVLHNDHGTPNIRREKGRAE